MTRTKDQSHQRPNHQTPDKAIKVQTKSSKTKPPNTKAIKDLSHQRPKTKPSNTRQSNQRPDKVIKDQTKSPKINLLQLRTHGLSPERVAGTACLLQDVLGHRLPCPLLWRLLLLLTGVPGPPCPSVCSCPFRLFLLIFIQVWPSENGRVHLIN